MNGILRKAFYCCLFALPASVTFAQTADAENDDFVEIGKPLFSCDFQNPTFVVDNFVAYDVDKLTPTPEMMAVGFDKNVWAIVLRDNQQSTNIFAGATSAYTPAGQADDWFVIKEKLRIPSKGYVLNWKSQASNLAKRDGLKVFISTKGRMYDDFADGLVFSVDEEEAGPTANVEGEWVEHSVNLDAYAGKDIYFAFVNQSYDKEMILIDDISIDFVADYMIEITSDEVVNNQTQTVVKGLFKNIEIASVKAFDVFLKGNDNEVKKLSFTDLDIKPGESHPFEFPEKLSIEVGKENSYKVWAHVDGIVNHGVTSTVSSLAFNPKRKIVIEEGTGAWCSACPTGIIALENLEKLYGNTIIPIAIHQGDDKYAYADYIDYLGFGIYPSGFINRKYFGTPLGPNLAFTGQVTTGEGTFQTLAEKAMQELTVAEVKLSGKYTNNQKKMVELSTEVNFAVEIEGKNYQLFYVIREDYLKGSQVNGLYTSTEPNAGEWGSGGIFGQPRVDVFYKDVARTRVGSFDGIEGLLPATVSVSTPFIHTFSGDFSKDIISPENVSVVAMLLNVKTGEVVNADMIYLGNPTNSIKDTDIIGDVSVFTKNDQIHIALNNDVAGKISVSLSSVDGKILNSLSQNSSGEEIVLPVNGFRGIGLLKISIDGKVIIKKLVL